MRFCKTCQNLLYVNIREGSTHELHFTCKNCNYSEVANRQEVSNSLPVMTKRYDKNSHASELDESCIMRTNYFDDVRSFQQYQTKNIKYDMTLPRVNNIECPHCLKNKSNKKEPEVICIRYDQANMKYLYFCCHCENFWKID